jgi:hypothetical protein
VHPLPAGGAVERLRAVKKLPKPLALAILCILLEDDDAHIAAGTVAAPWRDEFLTGALLDKKVLICKPR